MAAAARLAVAGHRVTVYERSSTYGGALGRFERDGFVFDTGPGLLRLPAVYRDLFVKTGKEPLESCVELAPVDPASRHVFADGTRRSAAQRLARGRGLRPGRGPGRGRGRALGRVPGPGQGGLGPHPPAAPGGAAVARLAGARPRSVPGARSSAGCCARPGRPPRSREIGALGAGRRPGSARSWRATPWRTASIRARPRPSAAVLPYMEQTFGSWYVRGGMRELARAVYERCLARKVEFVFGAEVTRSRGEGRPRRRASSWPTARSSEADRVVAGADPRGSTDAARAGAVATAGGSGPRGGAGRAGSRCCSRCAAPGPRTPRTARWCTPPTAAAEARRGLRRRHGGAPHGHGAAPRRPGGAARRRPRGGDADGDGRAARPGRLDRRRRWSSGTRTC